jgi:hypothetical protein
MQQRSMRAPGLAYAHVGRKCGRTRHTIRGYGRIGAYSRDAANGPLKQLLESDKSRDGWLCYCV